MKQYQEALRGTPRSSDESWGWPPMPQGPPPRSRARGPPIRLVLAAGCAVLLLVYMYCTHSLVLAAKHSQHKKLHSKVLNVQPTRLQPQPQQHSQLQQSRPVRVATSNTTQTPVPQGVPQGESQLPQRQPQQPPLQQQQQQAALVQQPMRQPTLSSQQQPASLNSSSSPCPCCSQCSCEMEMQQRDVVRLSNMLFKYETPFIDTVGMHNPAFRRLPTEVFPKPDPSMALVWSQLQPFMPTFGPRHKHNAMFNDCDSAVLFAVTRLLNPSRVFEVGSGFSTRVAHNALRQNAKHTGKQAQHLCIEPYRAEVLKGLGVQVVEHPVQQVDLALFDQLEAGDLLFLDNSHVTRPYGDVMFELLWILPRLQPGVLVHLHDIFLPWDYPADWMKQELRPYTEQYMLAAFLYGNKDWEVVLATNGLLLQALPNADAVAAYQQTVCGQQPGSSIYLRRKLPPMQQLDTQEMVPVVLTAL